MDGGRCGVAAAVSTGLLHMGRVLMHAQGAAWLQCAKVAGGLRAHLALKLPSMRLLCWRCAGMRPSASSSSSSGRLPRSGGCSPGAAWAADASSYTLHATAGSPSAGPEHARQQCYDRLPVPKAGGWSAAGRRGAAPGPHMRRVLSLFAASCCCSGCSSCSCISASPSASCCCCGWGRRGRW